MVAPGPLVQVEGGRAFRASLKKAGDDLQDMKAAHKSAAQIAATASRALAPVGLTGLLSRSIRGAGTKTAATIRAGNNTRVPYARPIHWGWHRRHIKPNPFLSHGAQNSEGRWIRVYEAYLETALHQVKGL